MRFNFEKFRNIENCDTFFKKFRGLMFSKRRNLLFDMGFETRLGALIHMFFVFFSIDVYWLDNDKNIVDYKENLKPFTLALPKQKARYVIEISLF